MLMETNTITYLARFIYRIRYKLFLGSIITCLLTIYFTKFLPKTYTVSTSIYTGIVSGGSINAETSMNWNETNNAFENIIQLIRSKKTLEQVSLRLLAQDLTYGDLTQDTRYISSENYKNLLKYTKDLTALVDRNSIEKTFQNLNHYLQDSPDNLIYRILSSERTFYSFHALNKISARRLGTSDILEIVYESSDPGITYNTIKLLTEELLKGYENIRFGASHDVIKYFEEQIRAMGVELAGGKDMFTIQGEYSANMIRKAFGKPVAETVDIEDAPGRPPLLCAGCPHRHPRNLCPLHCWRSAAPGSRCLAGRRCAVHRTRRPAVRCAVRRPALLPIYTMKYRNHL